MESQWKKLSGTDYIFRFEAKEDGYNLLVTDLVRLYCERVSGTQQVLDLCQKYNADFEVSQATDLLLQISKVIDSKDTTVTTKVSQDFSSCQVLLSGSTYGCRFAWKFYLKRSGDEDFFTEITEPNLRIVNHLLDAQRQLVALIKAKDDELSDYKSNGATLIRQSLETKPFSSFSLKTSPPCDFFSFVTSTEYSNACLRASENIIDVVKKEEEPNRPVTKKGRKSSDVVVCPIGIPSKSEPSQRCTNTQMKPRQQKELPLPHVMAKIRKI